MPLRSLERTPGGGFSRGCHGTRALAEHTSPGRPGQPCPGASRVLSALVSGLVALWAPIE